MNNEKMPAFLVYLAAAIECANMDDAQQLIDKAADDMRLSDQQYYVIRRAAIQSAHNENNGGINHE